MELKRIKCPNCHAELKINKDKKDAVCEYCGSRFIVDLSSVSADRESVELRCSRCNSTNIKIQREKVGTNYQGSSKRAGLRIGRVSASSGSRNGASKNYYRTVAICQNCGNTWDPNASFISSGKLTWWQIALWICFLPIMLSIWIWKTGRIKNKRIKIGLIAGIWILGLLCGGTKENKESTLPVSSIESESESPSAQEKVNETTETLAKQEESIVKDEVVQGFLDQYNANSSSPFSEVRKGNIRTKYYGYSYGYWCELLHANDTDKMVITINETNENAGIGVAGMKDIFRDVIKTIDESLKDEDINAYFDSLLEGSLQGGGPFGNTEIFYSPDLELSYGHHRGHIKIEAR